MSSRSNCLSQMEEFLSRSWIKFNFIAIPHFLYSFMNSWTLGLLVKEWKLSVIKWISSNVEHGDFTGISCFIILCFTVLHRCCVFHQLWKIWQPCIQASILAPFLQKYLLISCLSYYQNNSLDISNFFIIIILIMVIWSVIFDVTIVIALEHRRPCPYKMVKLIVNKCYVCSDFSTNQPFLHLSHSTQASLFPERQKFEIKTINKLTMASKCSSKRKSHSFLSRGSSQSRDQTQVSHIAGRFFTIWATREAPWWNKAPHFTHFKSKAIND